MILVSTPDGLKHFLPSQESISNPEVLAAYEAGNYEVLPDPEPVEQPPEPNWQDFRLSLMVNQAFREWAADLPADWREDLKSCALMCNAEALQSTYNFLAETYHSEPEAASEWNQIATANHIPVSFG